jgi:pimeloyl-ACP methyl ester carboxylesterase
MASIDLSYSISGSGPAIIFIHGIGARKSSWDELIKHSLYLHSSAGVYE